MVMARYSFQLEINRQTCVVSPALTPYQREAVEEQEMLRFPSLIGVIQKQGLVGRDNVFVLFLSDCGM